MSSAAEARFRIQSQLPTGRSVKLVHLDAATDRDIAAAVNDVGSTDLMVMVVAADGNAEAAKTIGEACSARRVMTTTIVIDAESASDEALSATLLQVRPWSLMVIVVNDADYVNDILGSFR